LVEDRTLAGIGQHIRQQQFHKKTGARKGSRFDLQTFW